MRADGVMPSGICASDVTVIEGMCGGPRDSRNAATCSGSLLKYLLM